MSRVSPYNTPTPLHFLTSPLHHKHSLNEFTIKAINIMCSRPSLCNLPGELQDKIIVILEPSAMVALSQTNHHFHTIASLHRLDQDTFQNFLVGRNRAMLHHPDFLCSSCLMSKSKPSFLKAQVTKKKRKEGSEAHLRKCFECMRPRISCGSIVVIAGDPPERKVVCMGCGGLRERFCRRCHWCEGCVQKAQIRTIDKNWRNGVPLNNNCRQHRWSDSQ